ncbi:hypothetical protein M0813_19460 [Anaeramoeba flamelloides]|uniref:Uncharacterized protein n=1 Tax=Anaeramoeba flamelloides TaxID=1746091 RepID=A0ABQ8YNY5_9EUKA|nr:hypothetical protein M0813_19460 [Anaeramoeba flamelloides]
MVSKTIEVLFIFEIEEKQKLKLYWNFEHLISIIAKPLSENVPNDKLKIGLLIKYSEKKKPHIMKINFQNFSKFNEKIQLGEKDINNFYQENFNKVKIDQDKGNEISKDSNSKGIVNNNDILNYYDTLNWKSKIKLIFHCSSENIRNYNSGYFNKILQSRSVSIQKIKVDKIFYYNFPLIKENIELSIKMNSKYQANNALNKIIQIKMENQKMFYNNNINKEFKQIFWSEKVFVMIKKYIFQNISSILKKQILSFFSINYKKKKFWYLKKNINIKSYLQNPNYKLIKKLVKNKKKKYRKTNSHSNLDSDSNFNKYTVSNSLYNFDSVSVSDSDSDSDSDSGSGSGSDYDSNSDSRIVYDNVNSSENQNHKEKKIKNWNQNIYISPKIIAITWNFIYVGIIDCVTGYFMLGRVPKNNLFNYKKGNLLKLKEKLKLNSEIFQYAKQYRKYNWIIPVNIHGLSICQFPSYKGNNGKMKVSFTIHPYFNIFEFNDFIIINKEDFNFQSETILEDNAEKQDTHGLIKKQQSENFNMTVKAKIKNSFSHFILHKSNNKYIYWVKPLNEDYVALNYLKLKVDDSNHIKKYYFTKFNQTHKCSELCWVCKLKDLEYLKNSSNSKTFSEKETIRNNNISILKNKIILGLRPPYDFFNKKPMKFLCENPFCNQLLTYEFGKSSIIYNKFCNNCRSIVQKIK